MKRLSFLAALFGVKIAAQVPPFSSRRNGGVCWNTAKPCRTENNACPLCGTFAKPFKPKPGPMCGDTQVMVPDADGNLNLSRTVSGCDESLLPKSRVTRCTTCNAAFWQDAEK